MESLKGKIRRLYHPCIGTKYLVEFYSLLFNFKFADKIKRMLYETLAK